MRLHDIVRVFGRDPLIENIILDVRVPGQPVGKGRPSFARRGANVVAFTPGATAAWEDAACVRIQASEPRILNSTMWIPVHGPLAVAVEAVCKRPKLLIPNPNGRKAQPSTARIWCCTKPDIDNIVKIALDALVRAHFMNDDTHVVLTAGSKQYAAIGEQEHVRITVSRVTP